MRSVEATVEVKPDGSAKVEFAQPLEPGAHRGLFVLEEEPRHAAQGELTLPALPLGFPPHLTFSREELYGDDGR